MQTTIIIFSHLSQENGIMGPSNFEGKINLTSRDSTGYYKILANNNDEDITIQFRF